MASDKVRQVQELRRSGAAGAHDSTSNRERSRAARERAALEDQDDQEENESGQVADS
jgi:hypothetical protein